MKRERERETERERQRERDIERDYIERMNKLYKLKRIKR